MADEKTSPPQPANPPKGTSPSPNIQRGNDIAWDSWHQHGNKDAAGAIADQQNKKTIPVGGGKK